MNKINREEVPMLPIQITVRDMPASDALEDLVRKKALN